MSEVIALRNCKDCIHVDVCRYRTDPGSKDCLCKHSAADVRPVVRGRWLYETEIEGHACGECSACHKIRVIDNFCPNCGADMRRGDDDGRD